jgi:hypothetical protein
MKKEIGIAIISIALIISVASPYAVLLIGIPVFAIGLICLWISKTNRKTKLLWSIIPPILWFPLTALWLFIYNSIGQINAQKKDFYVNDNFKGSFTVVESKCGKEPIIENDRLQFKIPENGVYLFNGELKSGHIDERVFRVNKDGTTSRIEDKQWPTKNEEKDTSGVEEIIGTRFGSFGTRTSEKGKQVNSISRYIETNKIYSDKEENRSHFELNKTVLDLLSNCEK